MKSSSFCASLFACLLRVVPWIPHGIDKSREQQPWWVLSHRLKSRTAWEGLILVHKKKKKYMNIHIFVEKGWWASVIQSWISLCHCHGSSWPVGGASRLWRAAIGSVPHSVSLHCAILPTKARRTDRWRLPHVRSYELRHENPRWPLWRLRSAWASTEGD